MMNYLKPRAVPVQSVAGELVRDISQLITTIRLGSLEVWYAQPVIRFLHSFGTKYVGSDRQQIISELRRLENFWERETGRNMQTEGEDSE